MKLRLDTETRGNLEAYCNKLGVTIDIAISKLITRQLNIEDINHDYLLAKYKNIADFDILDIATWDGEILSIKPSSEWPDVYKGKDSPIASLNMDRGNLVVKSFDKLKASHSIATHLGMFGDFNVAIGTLRKYGIEMEQDAEGNWFIVPDTSPIQGVLEL